MKAFSQCYQFIAFIVVIAVVMFTATSCQDDPPEGTDFSDDRQYLPMGNIGSYWEYQMDSTLYDNFGATITESVGYERHEVINVESSTPGDTTYTVLLQRRRDLNSNWLNDKQYRIEIGLDGNVNTTIDNLRFLSMKIPAMEMTSWDGILFDPENVIEIIEGEILNTYRNWQYEIEARGITVNAFGVEMTDCIDVREADVSTLIDRRLSHAFYCRGIGLVRLERSILDSQCFNTNPDCEFEPWEVKADKGYIMVQSLMEYSIL